MTDSETISVPFKMLADQSNLISQSVGQSISQPLLTSTMLMAMPYPTTRAARSRMYGEPARNLAESPALIFGLLFLPDKINILDGGKMNKHATN